jgi:uncharacterized membrane protein YuzA (DUF378 family)
METSPENIVTAVAGVGAANIGAAEFLNFDLMTEVFSGSPEIGAIAFGAAGVLAVTETFEFTELLD